MAEGSRLKSLNLSLFRVHFSSSRKRTMGSWPRVQRAVITSNFRSHFRSVNPQKWEHWEAGFPACCCSSGSNFPPYLEQQIAVIRYSRRHGPRNRRHTPRNRRVNFFSVYVLQQELPLGWTLSPVEKTSSAKSMGKFDTRPTNARHWAPRSGVYLLLTFENPSFFKVSETYFIEYGSVPNSFILRCLF